MVEDRKPSTPAVMERVELIISRLLLGGVVLSMGTVLVGVILLFAHHPEYFQSATDLKRLTTPGAAFPQTMSAVVQGVAAGRGQAVIVLGLLLLIATPIMRVAVSLIGFLLERDITYSLISALVLAILLIAFLLGKVE